jgi:hypothetical protein
MVIHPGAPVAVHAHAGAEAVTVIEADAPLAGTADGLVSNTAKVHEADVVAWVMVTSCPATVNVPTRGSAVTLAATT